MSHAAQSDSATPPPAVTGTTTGADPCTQSAAAAAAQRAPQQPLPRDVCGAEAQLQQLGAVPHTCFDRLLTYFRHFCGDGVRRVLRFHDHSGHRERVLLAGELYGLITTIRAVEEAQGPIAANLRDQLLDHKFTSKHMYDVLLSTPLYYFLSDPERPLVMRMLQGAMMASRIVCRIKMPVFEKEAISASNPLGICTSIGSGFIARESELCIYTNSHVMHHHFSLMLAVFSFYVCESRDGRLCSSWVDIKPSDGARRCVRTIKNPALGVLTPDVAVIVFAEDSIAAGKLRALRQLLVMPSLYLHVVAANSAGQLFRPGGSGRANRRAERERAADVEAAQFRLPRVGERVCLVHYSGAAEVPAGTSNEIEHAPQASLCGKVLQLFGVSGEEEGSHEQAVSHTRLPDGQTMYTTLDSIARSAPAYCTYNSFCCGGSSGSPLSDSNGEVIGIHFAGSASHPYKLGVALLLTRYVRHMLAVTSIWLSASAEIRRANSKMCEALNATFQSRVDAGELMELSEEADTEELAQHGVSLDAVLKKFGIELARFQMAHSRQSQQSQTAPGQSSGVPRPPAPPPALPTFPAAHQPPTTGAARKRRERKARQQQKAKEAAANVAPLAAKVDHLVPGSASILAVRIDNAVEYDEKSDESA